MRSPCLVVLFVAVSSLFAPGSTGAQTPEREIETAVAKLFDAMRAGDGAAAAALFHPEARLQSVSELNGSFTLRTDPPEGFVQAIGAPRDQVWDERIWDLEVNVDGGLATAWMRYAFYLDDAFSHCGVNAFQFVRGQNGWLVTQITDTRRTDACREPR